jgi:hypothetical protein
MSFDRTHLRRLAARLSAYRPKVYSWHAGSILYRIVCVLDASLLPVIALGATCRSLGAYRPKVLISLFLARRVVNQP